MKKKSGKKGISKKARRALTAACVGVLAAVTVYILLAGRANALLADTADAMIRAKVTGLANESVLSIVAHNGDFADLISVTTDANGAVSYVKADSVRMNALAYTTSKEMQRQLDTTAQQEVSIRLTTLLGSNIFSGTGPKISVKIQPIGSVKAAYISEFASAGINQTRHRIYLELSCDVYILMPSGSKRVSVAAQVVVSECLIVGVGPNSYVYVDDTYKMLNLIPD